MLVCYTAETCGRGSVLVEAGYRADLQGVSPTETATSSVVHGDVVDIVVKRI